MSVRLKCRTHLECATLPVVTIFYYAAQGDRWFLLLEQNLHPVMGGGLLAFLCVMKPLTQ